jgi:hypothetical protein
MIIKTLRHKGNSIKRLLDYIFDGIQDKEQDWVLAHNLPSFNRNEISKAYLTNDSLRSNLAKTRWYHEVLSFNPLDRPYLDDAKLWDLAQKYVELRNPNALVYAAPHKDDRHVHIHFAFSGIEYKSSKTLRMNDQAFEALHHNMETYQLEKYPELQHSFAYITKAKKRNRAEVRDQNTRDESYYQWQKNHPDKVSEKDSLQDFLTEVYAASQNQKEFYDKLQASGLELYTYRGEIKGIKEQRKYRFSTLGISKEHLRSLDRLEQQWKEMRDLQRDAADRGINE